jgi:signal transduction histidine kinase
MISIMVVEDEIGLREEIVMMLECEQYHVIPAEDGSVALNLLHHQVPDLIISDVSMPQVDGYSLLENVRANPALNGIPFIFLTAHAERSFMRHGMELGADDYIPKPFTQGELLASVRSRIGRAQGQSQAIQQELEALKSKLAHRITHELRTPLVSIRFVAEIIERQRSSMTDTELSDLLQMLNQGTDRLFHVVEQMVYLNQLDVGTLTEEGIREAGFVADLWPTLAAAIDLGRRYAYRNQDKPIDFRQYDRQVNICLHSQSLRHAIAELISNALNFATEDSVITIATWVAEGQAWISITDTNGGVQPGGEGSAGDAFFQPGREKQEQQGLGLGLHIASMIMQVHGGGLDFATVPGRGSQITLHLPVSEAVPEAAFPGLPALAR